MEQGSWALHLQVPILQVLHKAWLLRLFPDSTNSSHATILISFFYQKIWIHVNITGAMKVQILHKRLKPYI